MRFSSEPNSASASTATSNRSQPDGESDTSARLIAGRIMGDIRPSTVLVVGDGQPSLVGALRELGAQSYSLETSGLDSQDVVPEARASDQSGSAKGSLDRDYDLIVCWGHREETPNLESVDLVEKVCSHSRDVLVASRLTSASTESDSHSDATGYWAELFARHGFFRDLDFDDSAIAPWAVRFRRADKPSRVIAAYERRLWRLEREAQARRHLNIEQYREFLEITRSRLAMEARQPGIESTMGWVLLQRLQRARSRIAPPGSVRDQLLEEMWRALQVRQKGALTGFLRGAWQQLRFQSRAVLWRFRLRAGPPLWGQLVGVDGLPARAPMQSHEANVDIVVCVHNALPDVERCLESVLHHTAPPCSLILVDDGSDPDTRDSLQRFSETHGSTLLRNDTARGYTRAANQGLDRSTAEYVVLLNSDTVVTPEWLDRMVACIESSSEIGLVGPLSNTASWQSIPYVESGGDWAANPLPPGMSIDDMARLVARYSSRIYPPMPLLNGFCLLIRRGLIDEIGLFDEETFGDGYGEENDYALRARKAGWRPALADDAYVYHAQSRSYSSETRKRLSHQSGQALARKHGEGTIRDDVATCREDRVLQGIRARSRVMVARQKWIQKGREDFGGRRVLFALGLAAASGGANVVIDELRAMREMAVDARIFNLAIYREGFEQAYPSLDLPVLYGEPEHVVAMAGDYDAVVAAYHPTVEWLAAVVPQAGRPVRGYYIQDFEPNFLAPGTERYQHAWSSYTRFPGLVRFTKTEWNRDEVKKQTGADCHVVGASVNIDLFRPRPRSGAAWPNGPLRIAAMVRVGTPWRAPKLTMEVLQRASRRYRSAIEILLFGTSLDDPRFAALPRSFPWKLAGILSQRQVASCLNEADVFVDFSTYQAMGLTAMEAMACGAAAIVPEKGGADSFALHEGNCLVVDTSSADACWAALQGLVDDAGLRSRLRENALAQVCEYYPERPAYNILNVLLNSGDQARS